MPRLALTLIACSLAAGPAAGQPTPAAAEFFEKSVRPVLVERCLACHSAKAAKGGLRLDSRAALLRGGEGGAVVVPGKPEASRLIQAVRRTGELAMPPKGELPAAEVAALEKWVALGAPWPDQVELAPPDAIARAA